MYFKNNEEDYLKTIFSLSEAFDSANEKKISQDLNVSMATVSEYLNKLSSKNLIIKNGRGIKLTGAGYILAIPVIVKHRISEVFALKMLEVPWEETHKAVMDIEHTIDGKYFGNFIRNLGNPKSCPHGNPINFDAKQHDFDLDNLNNGKYVLSRIVYEDSNLLKQLADINMLPGTEINLIKDNEFILYNPNGEIKLSFINSRAIRVAH